MATLGIVEVLGAAALEYLGLKVTSGHSGAAWQALIGFLALVGVLALESRFSVVEGLDRHVLAGSLFSWLLVVGCWLLVVGCRL